MNKAILIKLVLVLCLLPQCLWAQSRNEGIAQAYLSETYPELSRYPILGLKVTDEVENPKNGLTHLYVRQTYQSLEILNLNLNFAIKNGQVIRLAGEPMRGANATGIATSPKFGAEQAVQYAANYLKLPFSNLKVAKTIGGNAQEVTFEAVPGLSLEQIPVKLSYFAKNKRELILVWDLSIYIPSQKHWWNLLIDAQTGQIVEQIDWVRECHFDHHQKSSEAQMPKAFGKTPFKSHTSAQYNVFAYPLESPSHGERSIEIDPWDLTASPYTWHDTDGDNDPDYTITRGNNVHAYEDQDADNQPGFSPDGGSELTFDFPIDFSQNPDQYIPAVVTNLFYWNNLIHDIYYHYGFDEASGNFQENNYGRGGSGGDYVRAEALDGSGLNNANFATPPEGIRPRMQMFVWTGRPQYLTVNSPASIAGTYNSSGANFGPPLTSTPITANAILVDDGSDSPTLACNALPAADNIGLAGNIAIVDRGECAFVDKVLNAQNAGAIAVIVCNNVPGGTITLGGNNSEITIPSIMISQADGNLLKNALNQGETVNVSLVDDGTVNRSSDLDNGIIIHEYGHGISIRLTGGANNSGCLNNAEQMGEGWSDYFALVNTMQPGDVGTNPRGIGTYAISQPVTGGGIRPAPYTTDMSVNGFTYADVNNPSLSQPHGIGFVWCTVLWDMTWLFIDRYGFDEDPYNGTGGNNIALQLVIDGLKLQPCNPGFVDGRDAILEADLINNGGANQDIIWEAFARRGLGFSANQGDSNNRSDAEEAFDMPPPITIEKTVDKLVSNAGDVLTYTIKVGNILAEPVNGIVLEDQLPEGLYYIEGSASDGGTFANGKVSFPSFDLGASEQVSRSFQVRLASAPFFEQVFNDDQESGAGKWVTNADAGSVNWEQNTTNPNSGTTAWFAENINTTTDFSLTLNKSYLLGNNSRLLFQHSYDLESGYDGGIVQISTDNGSTWQSLNDEFIENGYNGQISAFDGSSIAGQAAFSGSSRGYQLTKVDLSAFAGEEVLIRFRLVTDAFVGGDGWYVDDVWIIDGTAPIIENEVCINVEDKNYCSNVEVYSVGSSSNACLSAGGYLKSSQDDGFPLQICTQNIASNTFSTVYNYNSMPAASDYEYAFILANLETPHNIVTANTDGNFDYANLPEGNYRVWGLSYAKSNTVASVLDYVLGKTSISDIYNDIAAAAICADLATTHENLQPATVSIETCTATENLSQQNIFQYYPNPSEGKINLRLEKATRVGLEILDLNGKVLYRERIQANNGEVYEKTLNLEHLPNGVYVIKANIGGQQYRDKLIIQR